MRFSRLLFVFAVATALPGISGAQTASSSGTSRQSQPENKELRGMYEDVEIMRRLLNRKLAKVIGLQNCTSCHASSSMPMIQNLGITAQPYVSITHSFSQMQVHDDVFLAPGNGIYIKGQGVVYQSTLSDVLLGIQTAATQTKQKKHTEWELMQKKLRGEKAVAAGQAGSGHPDIVATILEVLAANGSNLSALPEAESITVSVAFSPAKAKMKLGSSRANSSGLLFTPLSTSQSNTIKFTQLPVTKDQSRLGLPAPVQHYLLLGDSLLRQGKFEAAVEAYQKALKQVAKAGEKSTLYRKIAEAYLRESHRKTDANLGQSAMEYLKKALAIQPKTASKSRNVTAPLLSRLIISVTKKDLDQMAKGKMNLEALRKTATVQWIRFGSSESSQNSSRLRSFDDDSYFARQRSSLIPGINR